MNSQRLITFLCANPCVFYWEVSEFYKIDQGVAAQAKDNHLLKITFNPYKGFQVLLSHQGKLRKKPVKRVSSVTPFDLHDVISNVLALINHNNKAA
ncbi:hypothetical protein [Facilibium subflavum]|uniref:hypothetical protein n=1 Tax=Facilibium subflavum TaxID=2219058 RepID=UPI000E654037|nr:hypothetical protein [Facilibium subflavum]